MTESNRSQRRKLFVLAMACGMLLALSLLLPQTAQNARASMGTPYATLSVPGTFEAEDFNSGANYDVYFAYASQGFTADPGNLAQNTTYRTGIGNIDLVDFTGDGETYVVSSNNLDPDGAGGLPREFPEQGPDYGLEYLKYTLDVNAAGWYQIGARAAQVSLAGTGVIMVAVDQIQLGAMTINNLLTPPPSPSPAPTPPLHPTNAADYVLDRPIYLTEGDHDLIVQFAGPHTFLDTITFTAIADPDFPAPVLITPTAGFETDEVVVASVAPDLDNTGSTDVAASLNPILKNVARMGGGTVFLEAGVYLLQSTLVIPENVELRGEWRNPVQGEAAAGTMLIVKADNKVTAVRLNGLNATLRDIGIGHPDQVSFTAPVSYPCSVVSNAHLVNIRNVTFYNSYHGICAETRANAIDIDHVYGTFLNTGITLGSSYEFSFLTNALLDSAIWAQAPSPIAAPNAGQLNDLNAYMEENLHAINIYHNDALTMYNVGVNHAKREIAQLRQASDQNRCPYGAMMEIHARVHEECLHPDVTAEYPNVDKVQESRLHGYVFAPGRMPASPGTLVNVKTFGAAGDGRTDDTEAIQDALDYAYSEFAGGTVIMPPGNYALSGSLIVPEGVELRGSSGYSHSHHTLDTTVLMAYRGVEEEEDDETADALITLSADSGARGFTIHYPEQGFQAADLTTLGQLYPIREYPYAIRSAGAGTWVKYVEIENGYNGLDFAAAASDDFILEGLWINAYNKAVAIGANTNGGRVEKVIVSYGNNISPRANSAKVYGWPTMHEYVLENSEPINIGNSSNISLFGFEIYASHYGFRLTKQDAGTGPQNLKIFLPGTDNSMRPALLAEGGGTIDVFGIIGATLFSMSPPVKFVESTTDFGGTLNVHDFMMWGNTDLGLENVAGGTVNLYREKLMSYSLPVSQGKPANDPNHVATDDGAERAVDGSNSSKWFAPTTNDKYLEVDLGKDYAIKRWRVLHAGVNGEPTALNTRDFAPEYYNEGTSAWTQIDAVGGNTANITDRNIGPTTAQKFRLKITQGTHALEDDYGRIYDFALYAELDSYANSFHTMYGEAPKYAVDGVDATKWAATEKTERKHWIRVDLGKVTPISRWVVNHAQSSTPPVTQDFNTYDYSFEVSLDGTNFTEVDAVSGNTAYFTDRYITEVNARYVRLSITQGTLPASDDHVRIQEFRVFRYVHPNYVNVTQGKPAVANNYNLVNETPAMATDGNVATTKWVSLVTGQEVEDEYWLVVDLGQPYKLESWYVLNTVSFVNTHYSLLLSEDGTNFATVDTVGPANSTVFTNRTLSAPYTARYAKLLIHGGDSAYGYANVNEFGVQD